MASKKNLTRNVVTSGNYSMATGGQPLFTVTQGKGLTSTLHYNVSPGQSVAWVVSGGVATIVDSGTITAAQSHDFHFGVAMMIDGKLDIREIGADKVEGCYFDTYKTVAPKCGTPEVVDMFFDCVKNDETYSVTVKVDDNRSRSFGRWNASAEKFVGSYTPDYDTSCDDCPTDLDCQKVACGLADALNNDLDLKIKGNRYPDWTGQGLERPFYATVLHPRTLIYSHLIRKQFQALVMNAPMLTILQQLLLIRKL